MADLSGKRLCVGRKQVISVFAAVLVLLVGLQSERSHASTGFEIASSINRYLLESSIGFSRFGVHRNLIDHESETRAWYYGTKKGVNNRYTSEVIFNLSLVSDSFLMDTFFGDDEVLRAFPTPLPSPIEKLLDKRAREIPFPVVRQELYNFFRALVLQSPSVGISANALATIDFATDFAVLSPYTGQTATLEEHIDNIARFRSFLDPDRFSPNRENTGGVMMFYDFMNSSAFFEQIEGREQTELKFEIIHWMAHLEVPPKTRAFLMREFTRILERRFTERCGKIEAKLNACEVALKSDEGKGQASRGEKDTNEYLHYPREPLLDAKSLGEEVKSFYGEELKCDEEDGRKQSDPAEAARHFLDASLRLLEAGAERRHVEFWHDLAFHHASLVEPAPEGVARVITIPTLEDRGLPLPLAEARRMALEVRCK